MLDFRNIQLAPSSLVDNHSLEYYGLASITAADELGLFDFISQSVASSDQIGNALGFTPRAVEALCNVLVCMGLLEKNLLGFSLTETAGTYWVSQSPLYRGSEFFIRREDYPHKRVVETLRTGKLPMSDGGKSLAEVWEKGEISHKSAQKMTTMMNSIILAPSIAAARSGVFNGTKRLVDVGGGAGTFGLAIVTHCSETFVTVMDLPAVCEIAREKIAEFNMTSRIDVWPASFFSDRWPQGADALLVSNILHDWPVDQGRLILKKACDSLPSGGKIFIHEVLLDEGKVSPKMAVIFNLLMYMNFQSQQFTFSELKGILEGAGFRRIQVKHRFGYYSLIEAEKDG